MERWGKEIRRDFLPKLELVFDFKTGSAFESPLGRIDHHAMPLSYYCLENNGCGNMAVLS